MKAKEYFTQEWGTGFTRATLSEKNGLLEMSMEDIYSTMEKYAELRLSNVSQQRELLAISCLKNIVNPINYLKELAKVDGGKLDGSYAIHLTKQGMFYQNLAKEALKEIDNCG